MGMFIIIGADHGAGTSRYLARTKLLDSKSCRQHDNKTYYGPRTVQFAEVDCKKDVFEVQAKVALTINKAKKQLKIPCWLQ